MKHLIRVYFLAGALLLLSITVAVALTTVSNADKYSYAANAGWINWQGDVTNGPVFTETYAFGYIYSANIGWINLGNGKPSNGVRYGNDSADDFGINVEYKDHLDAFVLTGFAYSANAGWINFDVQNEAGEENQPRIEKSTRTIKGYAWGGNIGWISLNSPGIAEIRTTVRGKANASTWMLY